MSEHTSSRSPEPFPSTPMPNTINMSTECLDRFARNFEASARRWELIVYPSLFAFIVLASYFFFLIYRLTSDVAVMARNVSELTTSIDRMVVDMNSLSSNMNAVSLNMNEIAKDLGHVSDRMEIVSSNMQSMDEHMEAVSRKMDVLEPMQASLFSMDQSTRAMATHTDHMRHSVVRLDRGINQSTAPIQRMGNFIPFFW